MKLFAETHKTQGQRKNDYANPGIKPGELVSTSMFECDGESIDGRCGCRRAFKGLESNYAITTAIVVEQDITEAELRVLVRKNLESGGWIKGDLKSDADEDTKWVNNETKGMIDDAQGFEVGTIIERRGKTLRERFLEEGGQ